MWLSTSQLPYRCHCSTAEVTTLRGKVASSAIRPASGYSSHPDPGLDLKGHNHMAPAVEDASRRNALSQNSGAISNMPCLMWLCIWTTREIAVASQLLTMCSAVSVRAGLVFEVAEPLFYEFIFKQSINLEVRIKKVNLKSNSIPTRRALANSASGLDWFAVESHLII